MLEDNHVHEFLGSTKMAGEHEECHNHRFTGISGPSIPVRGSHVHEIRTATDDFMGHRHGMILRTGPATDVGGGRHVHLARGTTTFGDGHTHAFIFATMIERPSS